jgi:hypothetical protein
MINEAHFARPKMPIRAILAKMRHDGCGGQGRWSCSPASSRPVRTSALLG